MAKRGPTGFFGVVDVSQLLALGQTLEPNERFWHGVGKVLHKNWNQWALYLLVAIHFAATLQYQFTEPDRGYHQRMCCCSKTATKARVPL